LPVKKVRFLGFLKSNSNEQKSRMRWVFSIIWGYILKLSRSSSTGLKTSLGAQQSSSVSFEIKVLLLMARKTRCRLYSFLVLTVTGCSITILFKNRCHLGLIRRFSWVSFIPMNSFSFKDSGIFSSG